MNGFLWSLLDELKTKFRRAQAIMVKLFIIVNGAVNVMAWCFYRSHF